MDAFLDKYMNLINFFMKNLPTTHQSLAISVWLIGIVLTVGIIPSVSAETDCNATQCDTNGENCQRVSLMPVEQCETLLAIYQNTDGPNWWKSWNTTSNEPRDFVESSDDGNVVALNLIQNNLSGELPDLSSLTTLKELNLRNNKLTGKIPNLSALTQLEQVSFHKNNLCGQIPDLSGLTHLKQLDISQNQLTGPIPDLSKLNNLQTLGLGGNQLCRDKNADYSRFENAVKNYPFCSDDDQYPPCVKYALTISKEGNGSGSVTGEGCGNDCNEEYDENTEVTLTATPAADSSFAGWSGACSGTETTCQVSMTQAQNVTASFNLILIYELTVNLAGSGGTGSVTGEGVDCGEDCSEQYTENTEVSLTAIPAANSTFVEWSGACSGTDICQIAMTQDQEVTASFSLLSTVYTLTVSKEGRGAGTVTGEGIDCGSNCAVESAENTAVTLTATPAADSTFAGWNGACSGTGACQVSMTEAQNVTATFNLVPTVNEYALTVNKNGTGTGTVTSEGIDCGATCIRQYVENTEVVLIATPAADSTFAGWSGACSGTASCPVIMNQAQTVTATFNLVPLTQKAELEFVGLKPFYNVGEFVTLDLVEHLQTALRSPWVDLWVAVESPDRTFYYMSEFPLQPFSLKPQPYRRGIPSSELVDTEVRYHLLYFDVPAGIGGTYNFYAIYNEAGADLSNLLKTQQSNLVFATTVLSNNINPSRLLASPATLAMLVGEELELIVDSETTLSAIRSNCNISPLGFVQSTSAVSSDGNGVSCYLKALKSGNATLTTTDKNGNTLQTPIIVFSVL